VARLFFRIHVTGIVIVVCWIILTMEVVPAIRKPRTFNYRNAKEAVITRVQLGGDVATYIPMTSINGVFVQTRTKVGVQPRGSRVNCDAFFVDLTHTPLCQNDYSGMTQDDRVTHNKGLNWKVQRTLGTERADYLGEAISNGKKNALTTLVPKRLIPHAVVLHLLSCRNDMLGACAIGEDPKPMVMEMVVPAPKKFFTAVRSPYFFFGLLC
jgi:hypothetical protein